MDYLQTTGDRLHDLELDRILARLRTVEAARINPVSTPAIVPPTPVVTAGVRSLTPRNGTPMFNDITLAVAGPLTISQNAQTLTLTCTAATAPATTVTPVAAANAVGTATTFAREDHTHEGVHSFNTLTGDVTLSAGTNIVLTVTGNNITISASGGSSGFSPPMIALTLAPANWIVPVAATEWLGSDIYRGKFDATHATQARLIITFKASGPLVGVSPLFQGEFSANGGVSWSALQGSSGPTVGYAHGTQDSGWITLTGAAQVDILLRITGSGGDGSSTVPLGLAMIQFK